jgi:hypothetical protein
MIFGVTREMYGMGRCIKKNFVKDIVGIFHAVNALIEGRRNVVTAIPLVG